MMQVLQLGEALALGESEVTALCKPRAEGEQVLTPGVETAAAVQEPGAGAPAVQETCQAGVKGPHWA